MTDESDIDALIESVASRQRIDWERVESLATSSEQRARLRGLRDVARLAEFHQSLQHDAGSAHDGRDVTRWGDLLLLERIATGANGEVYRGWDPALQREVAVKLMRPREGDPRVAADWLEEARALARVRDPHVVTVFGAAEHDGRAGLWMEFLRGMTLEQAIARQGPLAAGDVARLGAQIGRALGAAHAAGTLHRDVKPANILLEADHRAVLTDFGLGQRATTERDTGPFSGTPLFMSPQRLAGATAKPADDLYALGVTLRWAITGAAPFMAETLEQLRSEAARGPERALSAVRPEAPARLVAAIDRAMAPDPNARFKNAAELVAAFDAAAGVPGAAVPASRWAGAGLWIAVGAVLVALVWVTFAVRTPREPPRPAVVVPSPVPNAYDVSATFMRRGRDGDVRLESGDRVAPGDRLSLEFHATRPAWVYVLDADERGETYLLFPQPMFERANPLPRDTTIVLPGNRGGHENAWTVTSRGGREHLLVVANLAPLPELEAQAARLPAPVPNALVHYARVEASTMERLRGVGGVTEVPGLNPPSRPAPLFERIRALAGGEQGVRGTWVRQVVLENPLR